MQNRMLLITLILYYASENHENPHTQLHNIPSAHTSICIISPEHYKDTYFIIFT
jgi:hypothetical protein